MLYLIAMLVPLLYFLELGVPKVWAPNEAFYAEAASTMIRTGNYITPYYNGEIRLNKPPMTYWLVAFGYHLFGVNEWGLRFMHALLGLGTGLIAYLMAKEVLGDKRVALLSFLVLTLSLQFFANSNYASPEVPFTFFITLSLYLWILYHGRRKIIFLIFAFLSSSLAILVKGPAGFVIPAGVVFFYLLLTDPRELLRLRYYILSILALLLGMWWHAYQLINNRELFLEVFYRENIKRIYAGDEPFYFYLLDLNVSFLPYSLFFLPAILWVMIKLRREHSFFLVWFSFIFLLFSLISQKISLYVLPAFPALAIIISSFVLSQDWDRLKKYISFALSFLVGITILLGTFFFELPPYLALLALLPFLYYIKDYRLSPAVGGLSLVLFIKLGVLGYLEGHRGVAELGTFLKELDPKGEIPTYQVGHFHHSLPFYADRKIIRNKNPERNSLVVFKEGSFQDCNAIKTFKLYTGSESRLFKFLLNAKRGRDFSTFGVCLY
ncbi:MAG: glycosyltransferase family 39 protein [Acidobacteria bacterium]|jgi:4-amino-4-deoxy-L-arabinose transferase-like glycosyltransferase|nr:MAG: glycosyltransferase family 39 protein [Acidobacteriota bacterium]